MSVRFGTAPIGTATIVVRDGACRVAATAVSNPSTKRLRRPLTEKNKNFGRTRGYEATSTSRSMGAINNAPKIEASERRRIEWREFPRIAPNGLRLLCCLRRRRNEHVYEEGRDSDLMKPSFKLNQTPSSRSVENKFGTRLAPFDRTAYDLPPGVGRSATV
jgi:hypothetical protein